MTGYYWRHELLALQEWSNSKQKIALAIGNSLQLLSPQINSLIDVGCGDGDIVFQVLQYLKYCNEITLLDHDESLLAMAYQRLAQLEGRVVVPYLASIESLPSAFWNERSYDLVIASHILYYVTDVKEQLSNLYRLLRKNGILCLVVRRFSNDGLQIRRIFREHENRSLSDMIFAEKVQSHLAELGWAYSVSQVTSIIQLPEDDVREFLGQADTHRLGSNVTSKIVRLMGHAKIDRVPPELLLKLGDLFNSRKDGSWVKLQLRDDIILIRTDEAATRVIEGL